jgi:hypothetical protein
MTAGSRAGSPARELTYQCPKTAYLYLTHQTMKEMRAVPAAELAPRKPWPATVRPQLFQCLRATFVTVPPEESLDLRSIGCPS